MSSPATSIFSSPTIYGKVDYGPTFGQVYRPVNTKRIITAAGPVTIIPFDVIVVIKQTIPAAVAVQLPDLALWMTLPYGGFDLIIKNQNVGFDATISPFGTQKIDTLASLILGAGEGGGGVILSPLNDFSGWITL
jgi:hypothetical protein